MAVTIQARELEEALSDVSEMTPVYIQLYGKLYAVGIVDYENDEFIIKPVWE